MTVLTEWSIIAQQWYETTEFVKICDAYQFNENFIHQPLEPLHPTISSWPFKARGLDIVRPITPKASNGHMYIIAATDYFPKWAEAVTLREAKKEMLLISSELISSVDMEYLKEL